MLNFSESKRLLSVLFPDSTLFGSVAPPLTTSLQIARMINQVLEVLRDNGHYGREPEMGLNQEETWHWKAPSGNYKESEMAKFLNKVLEAIDLVSAQEFKTKL